MSHGEKERKEDY